MLILIGSKHTRMSRLHYVHWLTSVKRSDFILRPSRLAKQQTSTFDRIWDKNRSKTRDRCDKINWFLFRWTVVKLWGNAGERHFPSVFWRGNAVPLAYTTAVWVDAGERGVPPTPLPPARALHHQLKSKYQQFFARKPQVLLHSSDTTKNCGIGLLLLALLT